MSGEKRAPSADQLTQYSQENKEAKTLTTGHGAAIDSKIDSLTAGPQGPMLIQVTCLFICLFVICLFILLL